jgi:hypothetical protein
MPSSKLLKLVSVPAQFMILMKLLLQLDLLILMMTMHKHLKMLFIVTFQWSNKQFVWEEVATLRNLLQATDGCIK